MRVCVAIALGATIVSVLPGQSIQGSEAADDRLAAMRARVDQLIDKSCQDAGIRPAEICDDATFVRRIYLDLLGRIPRVSEARDFLSDPSPARRDRLIDQLIERPALATRMTNVWRRTLLPEGTDLERLGGTAGFESWLRRRFAENAPYHEIVSDLLLAEGAVTESGPALFYTAWEVKPEKLAASTSEALLGIQIQCAQCHDHPFDRWTQRDFWGYAAYFAQLQVAGEGPLASFQERNDGEVKLPDSQEVVPPRLLVPIPVGAEAEDTDPISRRRQLAHWVIDPQNPYFAKAAVNRVWTMLFGRGLVHPANDMGPHNPGRHPQLLEELAEFFLTTDCDLRRLIRVLAGTQAYARASGTGDAISAELFAEMSTKSLSAEQLYDSLATAIGRVQSPDIGGPTFGLNRILDPQRQTFLDRFRTPSADVIEYPYGFSQVLTMMNGDIMAAGTRVTESNLVQSLSAPFFTDDERIETLYLAALSRWPDEHERKTLLTYLEEGASDSEKMELLADILWSLLNSAEFTLNS